MLAGQLLGLSLRGLEVTLRRDQLLRWFCGFALREPAPGHSTLGRFAVWMQAHGTVQLYQAVLAQIVQDFPGERTRSQIGDTFALHSRAADTDRTALLRHLLIHAAALGTGFNALPSIDGLQTDRELRLLLAYLRSNFNALPSIDGLQTGGRVIFAVDTEFHCGFNALPSIDGLQTDEKAGMAG